MPARSSARQRPSVTPGDGSTAPEAPTLWGVVVLATLVIACAGIQSAASIVGPIFLVLTLVITVNPLRTNLVRLGVPRWAAGVVSLLAVYALLLVVLGSVVWSIAQLAETLPTYADAFTELFNQLLAQLAALGLGVDEIRDLVSQIDLASFGGLAQTLLNSVGNGVSLLALMVTVVVFLAFDAADMPARLSALRDSRPQIADALLGFASSVRKYWIVTSVFGLIVAIVDMVALAFIGVPLALTWGVLAFVTNYIPNIGFILGLIPPALVALLDGGVGAMVAVIISYGVINFVIQTLVQPRFTGDAVGITATVAFISLIFWAYILGVLGALLAVPATLFVKAVLIDHSNHGQWVSALISSKPDAKRPKKLLPGRKNPPEPETA